jgi:hypothetical protein
MRLNTTGVIRRAKLALQKFAWIIHRAAPLDSVGDFLLDTYSSAIAYVEGDI